MLDPNVFFSCAFYIDIASCLTNNAANIQQVTALYIGLGPVKIELTEEEELNLYITINTTTTNTIVFSYITFI